MVGKHETKRSGSWMPSPPSTTLPSNPLSRGKTEIDPDLAVRAKPPASTSIAEGHVLRDRYRILERIGSGGMGDVWKAEHVVIGRAVAIKVLTPRTAPPERAEPLMREARVIASLRHPNIVDITDFGHTPDGAPYLVMELLDGRTLRQIIESEGRFSWPRARSVLVQLTDALAHVHGQGIIHRDLKPENVFMIGDSGREVCKIIDFGIAKLTVLDVDARGFTKTNMVFGTPAFMGPEQALGQPVDHRTDVYALGCVAYEMLTGKHPFPGDTSTEVLYKQLYEHPAPMRAVAADAGITPEIEAVVMMAMRKTPALRFSDMTKMRAAVEAVGSGAAAVVVADERLPTPSRRAMTRFATSIQHGPPSAARAPQPVSSPSATSAEPAQPGGAPRVLLAAAIVMGITVAAGAGYLVVVKGQRGSSEGTEATPALHVAPSPSAAPHEPTSADTASEPVPTANENDSAVGTVPELDETPDVRPVEVPEGRPRGPRRRSTDRPGRRKDLPRKPGPVAPTPRKPDETRTPKAPPPARPDRDRTQDPDLVDPFQLADPSPGSAAG